MSRQEVPWQRIDRTLLSIQYLRAGSVLAVVFVHSMTSKFGILEWIFSLSMDLFFVMSGFIVAMIVQSGTTPWQFMRDRIGRIVPLYSIATLFSYWLIYSGALDGHFSLTTQILGLIHGPVSELFCALIFFPVTNHATGLVQPIIPQGWTLNYEMLFYLAFAAALWLPRRWLVPVLTLVAAVSVMLGGFHAQSVPARFWTSPLLFEFVAGLWIGLAWRRGWDFRWVFAGLLLAWVPLFTATWLFFLDWPMFPIRLNGFGLVLLASMPVIAADRRSGGLREWWPARLLGDASYSIYLFHFIPIVFAETFIGKDTGHPLAYFLVVFVGGLGLGLAAYFLIEIPLQRCVKSMRRHPSQSAAGRA